MPSGEAAVSSHSMIARRRRHTAPGLARKKKRARIHSVRPCPFVRGATPSSFVASVPLQTDE
jgi:hypothetical protein